MPLSPSDISALQSLVSSSERILVIPHANVDPDGLSSALACHKLLTALGKDVTVICPDILPESLDFLPNYENFSHEIKDSQNFVVSINLSEGTEVDKLQYTVEDNKLNIVVSPKSGIISSNDVVFGEGGSPYDLIIAVDTADTALFGSAYSDHIDVFSRTPIVNIDHHISNTGYGQLQLIDPTCASATEVLYRIFQQVPEYKKHIDSDMATLLLTGLITDTRSFQNPNTTPHSLEVAAELLDMGARQQEIVQRVYKTKPLTTLKIWGRALNRIQMDKKAGIVWSSVSKEDLAEMGATSKETHGILDELISTIPEADVHVLLTELENGGLKASLRSSPAIDVSQLAGEAYGGGGHARASGFRVPSFENFELQVLECISKLKEGMERQRGGETVNDQPVVEISDRESQDKDPKGPEGPKEEGSDGSKGTEGKDSKVSKEVSQTSGVDVIEKLSGESIKKDGVDIVNEVSEQGPKGPEGPEG